jgi:hypothetical protein
MGVGSRKYCAVSNLHSYDTDRVALFERAKNRSLERKYPRRAGQMRWSLKRDVASPKRRRRMIAL